MQQIEKNSPLVNISLLECLQGNKKSDELDLFIPFLAEILEELNTETIDKSELQNAFNDRFKIVTPLGALTVFVKLVVAITTLCTLNFDGFTFRV